MSSKGKILIIEDEEGLVLSLEDRLQNEGYEVAACGDGISGEESARRDQSIDLIILDVMLPGKDGFQICRELREAGNRIPILMLTARNTNIDTVMGLRLGADDYLPKPFDMQVLLARIDALLRRAGYSASGHGAEERFAFGPFVLDTGRKELLKGRQVIPLNAQEYRLLHFFVRNPGRVIDRQRLLDEVWGYDSVLTTRTVDVHVSWLRQKLDEQEVPRHIRTVRGHGYKFILD